jgi:DNA-binding transcriptional regulator YhcF (GntR family)
MQELIQIEINDESRVPKYKQIVDFIVHNISKGNLKIGQKIPSINQVSEDCYLSRDTVEKAYHQLRERKIIYSTKGKGYYIAKNDLILKINVLFLTNKLSFYKMRIHNSFVKSLGLNAHVDFQIYHCDQSMFLSLMEKNIGGYDYYVIMLHFKNEQFQHMNHTEEVLTTLEKVPRDRLILIDNYLPQIKRNIAAVYQDFQEDIYNALNEALEKISKYDKLILVYPRKSVYPYPREILVGFRKFCVHHEINFEILDEIYEGMELQSRDAYVIIEEMDLVNMIKQTRDKGLNLGIDIGIISYNDTPLKELLGITVISTDFKLMGETAAYMILKNKMGQVKNDFKFIDRSSI